MPDTRPKAQNIVVTGGAGFIGSHAVGLLLEQGHRVAVLDNYSTGKKENLSDWFEHPRLTVLETNIVDGVWPLLSSFVAEHGRVDRVIHLAAQTAVVSSIVNPLDDVRLNYATTVHVLEYARYTRVKKVVFASSAAVYGDVDTCPVDEAASCEPVSPYGIDKLGSEHYLRYYSRVHGVPSTSLRFFNVYGPRQDPTSAYSGVISKFFDRVSRNEDLSIFGDGEQTRDFVYVRDVADAIVRATLIDRGSGEAFNIGTGREVTINQLAAAVIEAFGAKSKVHHVKARPGEIVRSSAKIARAREALGFQAKVDIQEGLGLTADWFRSKGPE